jgi:FSR family fosmidomycin resistance protein-like MFS transporter
VVQFPWNTTSGMAMLLALFVFAGKSAGGFICDRVGVRPTAMISLIPAAILIVFCSQWMLPSLMGQFLLNLTMPVTLWLLYQAMPDSPGFAFGLAASALWPGTLVGRMINGQVLWLCVLISFSFGLIAILYSEKRILHGARRI